MSLNPTPGIPLGLGTGGLAARGVSIAEQANKNPQMAAALSDWSRVPAERVADSIGATVAQQAAETPTDAPEGVAAPVAPPAAVAPAVEPAATSPVDDEEDDQPAVTIKRKGKPWAEKEKEVRAKSGPRQGQHVRLGAEVYAKAWFVKGSTPGETWDSLVEEALLKLVNKRLKDMGLEP